MKSKQLNFYITPNDREAISVFLEENQCCVMADAYIKAGDNSCRKLEQVKEDIFQVYLTKEDYLKNVTTLSTENGIEYYDNMISPILQFNIGGFYPYDKSLLQRARFYYVSEYYMNEKTIRKSAQFIDWADSLMKDFKQKFLIKNKEEKTFLYSQSAIEWIENNNAELVNGGQQWKANQLISKS